MVAELLQGFLLPFVPHVLQLGRYEPPYSAGPRSVLEALLDDCEAPKFLWPSLGVPSSGTVKHPHVLGMALNIARNHAIYAASGSDFGLKGELSESRPSGTALTKAQRSCSAKA